MNLLDMFLSELDKISSLIAPVAGIFIIIGLIFSIAAFIRFIIWIKDVC